MVKTEVQHLSKSIFLKFSSKVLGPPGTGVLAKLTSTGGAVWLGSSGAAVPAAGEY